MEWLACVCLPLCGPRDWAVSNRNRRKGTRCEQPSSWGGAETHLCPSSVFTPTVANATGVSQPQDSTGTMLRFQVHFDWDGGRVSLCCLGSAVTSRVGGL